MRSTGWRDSTAAPSIANNSHLQVETMAVGFRQGEIGIKGQEPARRLVGPWPRERKADRALFEKLKEACVKACCSKHYRISAKQLEWLAVLEMDLPRVR